MLSSRPAGIRIMCCGPARNSCSPHWMRFSPCRTRHKVVTKTGTRRNMWAWRAWMMPVVMCFSSYPMASGMLMRSYRP
ncbi:MAG: hypothetical protein V4724_13940 [Pseudomonadota bacterium]